MNNNNDDNEEIIINKMENDDIKIKKKSNLLLSENAEWTGKLAEGGRKIKADHFVILDYWSIR